MRSIDHHRRLLISISKNTHLRIALSTHLKYNHSVFEILMGHQIYIVAMNVEMFYIQYEYTVWPPATNLWAPKK